MTEKPFTCRCIEEISDLCNFVYSFYYCNAILAMVFDEKERQTESESNNQIISVSFGYEVTVYETLFSTYYRSILDVLVYFRPRSEITSMASKNKCAYFEE